jgi:DNA-binding MarR family transcriptional regulator
MRLRAADARRILSFCLDRPFDVELSDFGPACAIRISPLSESGGPVRVFEADTFEEALRAAATAGLVRKECIERQITFYSANGERTFDAKAGQWSGPAFPPAPELVEISPGPGCELSMAHYRGLAEFRYQIRRFVSFSERAARAAGLEPPQHQLMLAIYGLPPSKRANIPTLAERMCTDAETCQALADVLLNRNLIRWAANPSDRREKLLALSEHGQQLLRNLTSLHRNQVLAVGPTFVQALGAILSSFEDETSSSSGSKVG